MPPADNSPPVEPDLDIEAMQRLAAGQREALAPLIERHQQRVLSLAYRFLGRWDLAEDVAQDVFIRVYRAAPTYRPEAAFTTWLHRLVANLCWDRRRQAARESRLRLSQRGVETTGPAVTATEAEERTRQVQQAVAALPDRQRLVLILHRYGGLSHREVAEATGWSASAVESCLVRAYERLRKSLSELMLE